MVTVSPNTVTSSTLPTENVISFSSFNATLSLNWTVIVSVEDTPVALFVGVVETTVIGVGGVGLTTFFLKSMVP